MTYLVEGALPPPPAPAPPPASAPAAPMPGPWAWKCPDFAEFGAFQATKSCPIEFARMSQKGQAGLCRQDLHREILFEAQNDPISRNRGIFIVSDASIQNARNIEHCRNIANFDFEFRVTFKEMRIMEHNVFRKNK